jgi:NADH dehydrogenase (ubiquinone) 1 beta subcomplex subunit 8
MLSRRIAAARPLTRAVIPSRTTLTQIRTLTQADVEDPNMVRLPICLLFDLAYLIEFF